MKKKVIIGSDSTCDLSRELLQRYQIRILPLGVNRQIQLQAAGGHNDMAVALELAGAWLDRNK